MPPRPFHLLRPDTPGTENVIHFNNAGAALPVKPVIDAVKDYVDREAQYGGYEVAEKSTEELRRPHKALAQLLNCEEGEIAVVESATLAWCQVFYGLPLSQGDRILTSVAEYGSNYIAFMQVAKRTGCTIEVIPETKEADIDLVKLEEMITALERQPALIAITHVPTSSGRVYDAAGVGVVARRHGIPYLLDACQSVGQMPVDVQALRCDFLTGTGRKYLRAPRGTGFLYASRAMMQRTEPAMVDLRGALWADGNTYQLAPDAWRYEFYESSLAARVGLGVAVDYYLGLDRDWAWEQIQALADHMRSQLREVPGVSLLDRGARLCGIVSFIKDGATAAEMKAELARQRINVSVSARPSTRIDFERRGLHEVVRASVHYYNTLAEVDQLVEAVRNHGLPAALTESCSV